MHQRTYPRPIVLRKGIVWCVMVGAMLIVLLIIYNIYRSSLTHPLTEENDTTLQTFASKADTQWYQDKIIKKVNSPSTANISSKKKSIETHEMISETHSQTFALQQDELKAMSASISSNQLTAEKEPVSSNVLNSAHIAANNLMNENYLAATLQNPISPYEIQAGTVIPGILITGINSDLTGDITGQVRENIYDSIAGKYLLIPQGSKIYGLYDAKIVYGQERVLIAWKRIIFPNGQSINLEGMPGVDLSGYAGFNDQVNNHYEKIFGSVILMSLLGAGAQLSQPQNNSDPFAAPTVGQTLAQSLGTNLANTGTMITAKNINIQPTLEIRPGYEFNISVTKDMVFPGSYAE
ncbi:MAG: hypothetical protein JO149_06945 [Gammaproteobacteria bacterium]|nr:hypothetical protein [Gammaproteobacteria bacterium]